MNRSCITVAALALLMFPCLVQAEGKWFRYAEPTWPESFDPHQASSHSSTNLLLNVYEGLTVLDPKTLSVSPGVAAHWQTSQDGKVVTFFLRDNARWSDQKPVTAHDFLYAWRRLLKNRRNPSPYAYQFFTIAGAKALNDNVPNAEEQFAVQAVNDKTLVVKLAFPVPYFFQLTSQLAFAPLPRHQRLDDEAFLKPAAVASNGAFAIQEIRPGSSEVVLVKNPHYWGQENVAIDGVIGRFGSAPRQVVDDFIAGKLDFASDGTFAAEVLQNKKLVGALRSSPWLATFFLRLNCTQAPLISQEFRQALNLAIDREQLVKEVGTSGLVAAYSLVPPWLENYTSQQVAKFDPVAAKERLVKLGYCRTEEDTSGCRRLPAMTILNNDEGEEYLLALKSIARMWRQNLGLPLVTIQSVPWQQYLELMKRGEYQIARSGWAADYADASTFLKLLLSQEGNNRTGWQNAEYDQLLWDGEFKLQASERAELFRKAETILNTQLPVIPIHYLVKQHLVRSNLKGVYENPLQRQNFKTIDFEETAP